jgi:hypothetical protein
MEILPSIILRFLFIQMLSPIILPFLNFLINSCLTKSIFPSKWKYARVAPTPKVKIPKDPSDFRPISILPSLSKVMKIIMKNQILSFVNENNYLCDDQSGFKNNHSTETILITVVNDVTETVDKGNLSILVLVDFSKAFINNQFLFELMKVHISVVLLEFHKDPFWVHFFLHYLQKICLIS